MKTRTKTPPQMCYFMTDPGGKMAPKREARRPLSHVGLKEEELIYLSMNLGISERCEVATLFLTGVAISPIFHPSRPVKIPFRPLLRRFLGFWTYNWARVPNLSIHRIQSNFVTAKSNLNCFLLPI